MKLIGISSVFVPFEKSGKRWIKRDDLPRFLTTTDAMNYLRTHPHVSWRRSFDSDRPTDFVQLEWREHSELDLIREYAEGVGTPEFNLRRWKR